MAGALLKTFGSILLVFGILGLVAGIGAAGYGFMEEDENQERGLFANAEESDQNEGLLLFGAVAAGAGLLLVIVGVVALVWGGARSRNALVKAIASKDDA